MSDSLTTKFGDDSPDDLEFTVASNVPTSESFLEVVEKSRLISRDALETLRREINSQPNSSSPKQIAARLVAGGQVTRWQAQQLLAGCHTFFLGKYKLLERIGRGGMGVVFKAQHQLMGRVVALKVIHQRLLSDSRAIPQFLSEIRAIAALEHPNIVTAHDADHVGQTHFLVMEYVDGQDLGSYIKHRGPLPVKWACEFCRQAALGLQHAHSRGLLHRDIKPSNLFVVRPTADNPPIAKILDFGLSQLAGERDLAPGAESPDKLVGTVGFLSPEEVLHSSRADIRSDIFSLGCTLFYLLTGRLPFEGETEREQFQKLVQGERLSIRSFIPDLPSGLENVLEKMMASKPEDRYQTPHEVADALWPFSASTRKDFASAHFPVPIPASIASQLSGSMSLQPRMDTAINEFGDLLSNHPAETADPLTATKFPSEPATKPVTPPVIDKPDTMRAARKPQRRTKRRPLEYIVAALVAAVLVVGALWLLSQHPMEDVIGPGSMTDPNAGADRGMIRLKDGRPIATSWTYSDADSQFRVWYFSPNIRDRQEVFDLRHATFVTEDMAEPLLQACVASNELTIEAVITPETLAQSGPAGIISFSSSNSSHNFTLGQQGRNLVLRLRTSRTGDKGANDDVVLCKLVAVEPQHVIVSYMAKGKLRCYLDGKQVLETDRIQGDFSNWTEQHLLFGDEWDGGRKWRGKLQFVTIYSRAIDTADEARLKFAHVRRQVE